MRIAGWFVLFGIAMGPGLRAPAVVAADGPAAASPSGRLDALLDEWGDRSARVARLDVEFRRTDADEATRERSEYVGRLLLETPHRAFLDVRRVGSDGRTVSDERAVCDGRDVAWFHPEIRRVLVVPFLEDVDRDLSELNVVRRDPRADLPAYVSTFLMAANVERHGPVPFLWGVQAYALRSRYDVELVEESPSSCRLRFRPRTELERSRISEARVDLSKATFQPTVVTMRSPEGTQTQEYRFSKMRVDVPIAPGNFAIQVVPGWETVRPVSR